jgi:hypothetical protein
MKAKKARKRKPVDPKHKEFVLRTLQTQYISNTYALADELKKRFSLPQTIETIKTTILFPTISELRKEKKPPFIVSYGDLEYTLPRFTKYHTRTYRVEGMNLDQFLLQCLADGTMIELKPVGTLYRLSGNSVGHRMGLMEKHFKSHGLRFVRRGSGAPNIVTKEREPGSRSRLTAREAVALQNRIRARLDRAQKTGELLNVRELARSCGVSNHTAFLHVAKILPHYNGGIKPHLLPESLRKFMGK